MYVPALKWKEGEIAGYANLRPTTKAQVQPLVEVCPQGLGKRNLTYDGRLNKLVGQLDKAIGTGRPFFLDLQLWDQSILTTAGLHPLVYAVDACKAIGLDVIPVVSLGSDRRYQVAVQAVLAKHSTGLCMRIEPAYAMVPGITAQAVNHVHAYGIAPMAADLIFDVGEIATHINRLRIAS
jgi:hypothetical protein